MTGSITHDNVQKLLSFYFSIDDPSKSKDILSLYECVLKDAKEFPGFTNTIRCCIIIGLARIEQAILPNEI